MPRLRPSAACPDSDAKRRLSTFVCPALRLWLMASSLFPEFVWTAVLPGILLILLAWGAVELFHTDPLYLVTAGFWFRLTAAVSFRLGGLWRVLATESTAIHLVSFFNPSQEEIRSCLGRRPQFCDQPQDVSEQMPSGCSALLERQSAAASSDKRPATLSGLAAAPGSAATIGVSLTKVGRARATHITLRRHESRISSVPGGIRPAL
jgi:hypothetical protein